MNRLFIADQGFEREIPRINAKGYKRVVISDELEMAMPFEFQSDGDDLVAVPAELEEGAGECYTMLCREFGLVGGSKGQRSKVSVIFCDDGLMLVTLYHGCLVMNLDHQLLMPMVGDDVEQPRVVNSDIMWVNADKLMGYKQYIGTKGYFLYDHEFMLELGGDNVKGMGNFIFRLLEDETLDISMGFVAQYEQTQMMKQQALEAKKMAAAVISGQWGSGYDFDDEPEYDEPDETEEDDDDDSGVEW